MLGTGVDALRTLVPSAGVEACATTIVSLLRKYTTGLSLAVAADELDRVPSVETSVVYRGRVTNVTPVPLPTWHLAGSPGVVLYVHSRLANISALDSVVRLHAGGAQSISDSPASVVSAARKTLGDCKVVVHLPTREIVIEPNSLPEALTLQEVWTRRELKPSAVRATVAEIDIEGELVRLVDAPMRPVVGESEEEQVQPSVMWRLENCGGIAELLAEDEVIVVTLPTVIPTGQSFDLLHGTDSVVYCRPKAHTVSRPQKRARTAMPKSRQKHFFGYDYATSVADIVGWKGAIAHGMVTVARVRDDFRHGVLITCRYGYELAFAGEETAARTLIPGTAIWLDGVVWDDGRKVWIVHSFVNLSEMTALLNSPFVRVIVPLRRFQEIAKTRGCCTVQACVRVVKVKNVNNLNASLRAVDVAPSDDNSSHANGAESNCVLIASERIVLVLYDRTLGALKEALKGNGEYASGAITQALFVSVIITSKGVGDEFLNYMISAVSPAPIDS